MSAPGPAPDPLAAPVPAVVVGAREEGRHYRVLRLARPDRVATRATVARYRAPGQYVRLAAENIVDETFFAMAGPPEPDADALELLIRTGSPLADHLATRRPGDRVLMSEPEGPGFDLAAARGHDLLLLAAGSGIAPIRAAAHAVAADRGAYGAIALYYGQHHEDDFAYRADLDRLAARDIRLVLVVSGDQPDWTGHRGYVQRVAAAEHQHWSCLLVCGMPEMEAEARHIAGPRPVLTNT